MARRVAGQSTRTGTQGRSLTSRQKYIDDAKKKKKTAARRVAGQSTRTGVQGRSLTSRQKYIESAKKAATTQKRTTGGTTSQSAKKTQKQKKSAFATYIENVQKRMSGGIKNTSKLETYKKMLEAKAKTTQAQKKEEEKSQIKTYWSKTKEQSKAATAAEYNKLIDNETNPAKKAYLTRAKKEQLKNFDETFEAEKAKSAKTDLDKKLTQIGAKGLAAQQKEVRQSRKKIEKEAEYNKKKDKENKLTSEEQAEYTLNKMRGTPEKTSSKIKEKQKWNLQRDIDTAGVAKSSAYGVMSGAMPFSDYVKEQERRSGIKLDDTKLKERTSYKVGDMVGFMGMSMLTGGPVEGAALKAGSKMLAKTGAKKASSKAAKMAVNVGADIASGLPMNLADAAENSESVKDFAKNLAVNTAMDAGLGGVIGGVRLLKGIDETKLKSAVVKSKAGKKLDVDEAKELNKFRENAKAAEVLKNAQKNLAGTQQSKVDIKKKTAPTIGGGNNRSLRLNDNPGTPSVANPSSIDNSISDSVKKIKAGQTGTKKIDLISTPNADVGPVPTAKGAKSSPIKDLADTNAGETPTVGQNPTSLPSDLNPFVKNNISDSAQKIKAEEPEIGDIVDNATIERANKSDSAVMIDLESDPHVRDILSRDNGTAKDAGSLKQRLTATKDMVAQKTVDSLQGIEKMGRKMNNEVGEQLIAQASALRRSSEKASFNIFHKQTDFNGQIIGKGAMEILRPILKQGEATYKDFNAYLFHRVNIDRFKNGKSLWGEDVVSPEKSRQIISQLNDKYPDFSVSADEVVQFYRNHNTVRVQSGLISQDVKDALEGLYENYVSAYRQIDKRAAEITGDGLKVKTGIRAAKGGDQAILPIHEQMVMTTQNTWKSAELNETIRQIAEAQGLSKEHIAKEIVNNTDPEEALADMLNRSTFFEKEGNMVKVVYFEKGQAKETHVSKLIYDGLKQWAPSDKHIMLDTGAFDRLLTGLEDAAKGINNTAPGKALIGFNNLFKGLITSYNPFFLIRNGLKDLQDIPVNSTSLTGFIKNMPAAFKSMSKSVGNKKDVWWETYLAAGSRYSGIIDPEKALKPKSNLGKANPLYLLEQANMAVESFPRYTEFRNILDQQGVKDITKATREQIEKAAKGAADVTCDFGRSGSLTAPVNRSMVPFLNASIQGADKLWRVLSGQKGFKGYASLMGKLTALGAAPAVAQEVIYANDPDYQQLNARDRAGNFFIKNVDGTFWKIPRGRAISTLTNPMQQAARAFVGNDKMSFDEFVEKLTTDIAPVNPNDSFILKQLINTYTNQTWYGGVIEGYSDQFNDDGTVKSKIERYSTRTSKIGIALSEKQKAIMTKLFGEEKAEALTMSPMKWDYLIDSYGGIAADIALSSTKLGKTQSWWKETFDSNFKKDPVYSNNLSTRYYEQMDKIKEAANREGATAEEKMKTKMLGTTNGNLSDLKELQDQIRYDKDMSLKEKARIDRELQKQINNLYRSGVSKEAQKAFDDFISKNKDKYMSEDGLAKAAAREHEKVTHATVNTMDTLYKYGGLKAVLKNKSSYMKDGEKVKLSFTNDKTIGKMYKEYSKDGGKDDDFYNLYRAMTKANKEDGIGTNAKYGNLAAVLLNTSNEYGSKKALKKAFGVTDAADDLVKKYLSYGGSKVEYMRAAALADSGSSSLKDKQKDGSSKNYNYDAPFQARALAGLPDRAYMVINGPDQGRRAEYYINNSRGLAHYNISLRRLQELDNKVKKGDDGYNTKEGVEKVLNATDYNREEKALLWAALYGLSYRTTNPYGSIRDYSLKSDVGIDTSGGWKKYGSGYRRYGSGYRRRSSGRSGGGSGGSSSTAKSEWQKYVESMQGNIETAKVSHSGTKLSGTKIKTSKSAIDASYDDALRKAVVKLLAAQRKKKRQKSS